MRHFLTLLDLTGEEIHQLLVETDYLKAAHHRRIPTPLLTGRTLALVFEKPSLRTRVSFQAGVSQLGGNSLFLSGSEVGIGARESVPDAARTISQYVDGVVLRTFSQRSIEEFAAYTACPVINGLSDAYHPCQALADVYTVKELFGELTDQSIVFVGDGNNVARSLAICCGKLGLRFILAAPKSYQFDRQFVQLYQEQVFKSELVQTDDPRKAVQSADIVYTDVWTSMGQETEKAQRLQHFAGYQINADLMKKAPAHAWVMHCLPARRGEEIAAEVLDGPQSVVFQQAANRMHVQKSLLKWLLT